MWKNSKTERAYTFLNTRHRQLVAEAIVEAENQDDVDETDYVAEEIIPVLQNYGYPLEDVDLHEIAVVFMDDMGGW